MSHDLLKQLTHLNLKGVIQSYEIRNQQALTAQMPYLEFLNLLMSDEVCLWESKKYEKRLKSANLKGHKTLENYDFGFNPNINKPLIYDLATCKFVLQKTPVIIVGPCGTGKSHLAQALGFAAIQKGFDVLMTTQSDISMALNEGKATSTYHKVTKRLAQLPVLIIDDFALKPLSSLEEECIHELIDKRSEMTSTIITSNLDPSEWLTSFTNKLLGAATTDRLQHNATLVKLEGKSFRTQNPATFRTTQNKEKTKK
jgi:DNA replication protein DnaC